MKKPIWAEAVGIIAILWGLFGTYGAVRTFSAPREVREMVLNFEKLSPKLSPGAQSITKRYREMAKNMPNWITPVCVVFGIAGLIIYPLYIFAGVNLIMLRIIAIKLFYFLSLGSILLRLMRTILFAKAFSSLVTGLMAGGFFPIMVDVVLLIFVIRGNKEAFRPQGQAVF